LGKIHFNITHTVKVLSQAGKKSVGQKQLPMPQKEPEVRP